MADDPGMTRTQERIKQLTDEAEGACCGFDRVAYGLAVSHFTRPFDDLARQRFTNAHSLVHPRQLRAARLTPFGAVQATMGKPGRGFIPVTLSQPEEKPDADTDLVLVRQGWAMVTALHGTCEGDLTDLST